MQIIIARHGETMEEGKEHFFCGTRHDVPLVERGGKQAETLAAALKKGNVQPTVVCCGTLQRHRRYAEIIMEHTDIPGEPIIDERLNEIDFGDWSGRTHKEVAKKYGEAALKNWYEKGDWPTNAGWQPEKPVLAQHIEEFMASVDQFGEKDDTILIITSGATLQFFLQLIPKIYEMRAEENALGVQRGNVCKFVRQWDGTFHVAYWNLNPLQVVDGSEEI